ncbi:T9SS type A sorting domain-containing protein [Hymenobacter algoricola]|uniref:T9SS type A sorting domain-containing protein n=1 Tax=Hymenobacter algoricola TaxID=486267 RepID=A0ABP7MGQ3_9BACT
MALNTIASVSRSAADANGNVYLTGSFTGTATFGSFSLTSAGDQDVFVAKWNPTTQSFLWAQRAGGAGYDAATTIAVWGNSIYIGGSFRSAPAAFGSLTVSNAGFLNTSDMFVAKLTDAGSSASFSWVQRAGGMGEDRGQALAVSGTGLYVTGVFEGSAVAFGSTSLSSNGISDIFIAKLTDAGTSAGFVWAQRMGGTSFDTPNAVVVNGADVYVAGSVTGTVTFNSVPQTGTPFGDSGGGGGNGGEGFVVKLTDGGTAGSYTWIQRARGQGYASVEVSALAVEGTNVYLGGRYFITGATGPSVTFGSITLSYPAGSSNFGDIFLAKILDAGATSSFIWAQQAQSQDSFNSINSLRVSGTSLYIAGSFSRLTGAFGNFGLSSAGGRDVFVAKLTDTGTAAGPGWAQRAGGPDDDVANDLALTGSSLQVVGLASAPASFGSQVLSHPLRNVPFGFMASLTDPTITAAAAAVEAEKLALYPNPARTTVQVAAATATTTLTLLDALGRPVRTATGSMLSVQGVAAGLYVVRAATPGQPARMARLVVE